MELDKDKYEKDRTICKNCYNEKESKHKKISENLSANDQLINNRTLLIGISFSGQPFLMLKVLSRLPD